MFKRLGASYTPGRTNSGGNQLKHKFYATCSAVVSKVNNKRSVELRLLNGDGWQPVGNVTIPVNFKVPEVGQVTLHATAVDLKLICPTPLAEVMGPLLVHLPEKV